MQSSIIGKIEKAKRYAAEPERIRIDGVSATVRGDNGEHRVALAGDDWSCTCGFFAEWSICSHTMALERALAGRVPAQPLPVRRASGA